MTYIALTYITDIAVTYILFLRINMTENNFSQMGNRTHDLGINRLAYKRLSGLYRINLL